MHIPAPLYTVIHVFAQFKLLFFLSILLLLLSFITYCLYCISGLLSFPHSFILCFVLMKCLAHTINGIFVFNLLFHYQLLISFSSLHTKQSWCISSFYICQFFHMVISCSFMLIVVVYPTAFGTKHFFL